VVEDIAIESVGDRYLAELATVMCSVDRLYNLESVNDLAILCAQSQDYIQR
jgi:hypothetical protein